MEGRFIIHSEFAIILLYQVVRTKKRQGPSALNSEPGPGSNVIW